MVENDIYDTKKRYEAFKRNLYTYLAPPIGKRKFQIKYKNNIRYLRKLLLRLEAQDNSYVRRLRLMRSALLVCTYIDKDLVGVSRDDIDYLMRKSQLHCRAVDSKRTFVLDVKYMWRILFPDKDAQGREDDTIIPYVVRHLRSIMDKSTEKIREDRVTWDEYQRLLKAFADDVRMQALISLAVESLGRPQELLGRKIKNVELYDNYAKVIISERGKKGVGILRCIDSYYYVGRWYNQHPLRHDPEAYFFINTGRTRKNKQFKPEAANKLIRKRCEMIGIKKRITLYSLKRNGVTFCRMRGDSDVDIQHRARWTSTKQLKTYDLSHHDDSFKKELINRGLIKPSDSLNGSAPEGARLCAFCKAKNGIAESICHQCQRPLDREHIEQAISEELSARDKIQGELKEMRENMRLMMEREQIRAGYDQTLNAVVAMPEFKGLWEKAKERERAMQVLTTR